MGGRAWRQWVGALAILAAGLLLAGALLAACEGPGGKAGPQGTPCWDLNNNGKCDLDTEDINSDGVCNALDCAGKPGTKGDNGTSCWDINGNGHCDLAGEDTNGDGKCTAADCVGVTNGAISGKVTNKLTKAGIDQAKLTFVPPIATNVVTGADGSYSVSLPIGLYTITYANDGFTSQNQTVVVVASQVTTQDVVLAPMAPVLVSITAGKPGAVGGTVVLTATVTALDGSTVSSYSWAQTAGATAAITGGTTASASVTLTDAAAYKAALFSVLHPPDRLMVQGISPNALEKGSTAGFTVTVTTTSGSYKASIDVAAPLPYAVSTGLNNLPLGLPVLVHGKSGASYSWSLTTPSGAGTLDDAADQNPSFTPAEAGSYTLTDAISGGTLTVVAGTWKGVITGQGTDGYPLADGCMSCHDGSQAPDKFTDWKKTGHAKIFSESLNTLPYYSEACLSCHTVGFDKTAVNAGMDDASDYAAFIAAKMIGHPNPKNWTNMLAQFPNSAKLANAQCENCHGPNGSSLHEVGGSDRISISSDVCGSCHGEPPRHGRFQQWQLSGHSSYDLALGEGTVEASGTRAANCGRCHAGQGYLAWLDQGDLTKWIQGASGNATVAEMTALGMTKAAVHPQTCTTCHDPHSPGSKSGLANEATVRVSDNTPMLPAGFTALGVGRGAICMTCHNTRAGAHNDLAGDPPDQSSPHVAAPADVIMGENAYFVDTGDRSPHSYIKDTCATCHMELTKAPADLIQAGDEGTNHTFTSSLSVCGNCHGAFDGSNVQLATQGNLDALKQKIVAAILAKLNGLGALHVRAFDPATFLFSSAAAGTSNVAIDTTTNLVLAVDLVENQGQIAFAVTLTNPMDITWTDNSTTNTASFVVEMRSLKDSADVLVYATAGNMVRAIWNYMLIEHDSSKGVHNPSFATGVLTASARADLTN